MSADEMTAWLQKQVEADLAAARIISAGGFSPQRWDTEPPGQVNPEDIPQSDAVTAALGCEPEYICGWVQIVAYDKLNIEPDEMYGRDSEAPFALVDNGRRQVEHIIRHDPRNAVARCEAELAILDEHRAAPGIDPGEVCCITCGDYPQVEFPCRTVRLLGSAYQHRDGFRAEWAQP